MVLTIEIRNPSSIDKEAEIQKSRLSWIPLHRANKYRLFLKSYSDAEKKSNLEKEWDKENVWALKNHITNLLYGRSRLRAKSVSRFIDKRPVYCFSCVGEEKTRGRKGWSSTTEMKHWTIYIVFGLIAKLTLNCGLQVKKYDFPNLQKLASIRGEIGENTPNT